MADIDLKSATPDTSLPSTGFLFGADSQSAASPSVYSTQTVATALLGSSGLTGGTVTTSQPLLDLAQTWNAGAVAFSGAKFSFVQTANATGSAAIEVFGGSAGTSRRASLLLSADKNSATFGITTPSNAVGLGITPTADGSPQAGFSSGDANTFFLTCGTSTATVRVRRGDLSDGGISVRGAITLTTDGGSFGDTILTRRAAANLRLGAADAAAPVAQTLSVQSVVAGTTDTAGANLTITGSQGTGTGAGGSIVFQVAPAGSTGTAQNALATALTINSAKLATFEGNIALPSTGTVLAGANCAITFDSGGEGYTFSRGLGGSARFKVENDTTAVNANGSFGWSNSTTTISTVDTRLYRDAANTLALRNGANAQRFNLYGTYTSTTNYERLSFSYNSGTLLYEIGTEKGSGGGTGRALGFSIAGTLVWAFNTSGHLIAGGDGTYDIGTSSANRPRDVYVKRNLVQADAYHELSEMTAPAAPAANGVRIYAEDDGSGKTRLMARFATGAAVQIAIEP